MGPFQAKQALGHKGYQAPPGILVPMAPLERAGDRAEMEVQAPQEVVEELAAPGV